MGTEGDNLRVVAGRYRLEARLGQGGMGVVWRATDQLLGRQVAVKELPLDDTLSADEARGQRERTLREARAVAQLRHPHVIVVHDVVEDGERPYIVMELIRGGSLADRIAERGPVDAAEAARIGIALLGALGAAHAAGVLHRDIKPANVLLEDDAAEDRIARDRIAGDRIAGDRFTRDRSVQDGLVQDAFAHEGVDREGIDRDRIDRDRAHPAHRQHITPGRVILTDFGIAQVAGASTLSESGAFVGSPEYTAPERMSGAGTGPASDLWSLGALLCTALSGESPFRRDSLGGILHAVVSAEIRPPAQAGPILPVIRGLLERDPGRRLDAREAERMLRDFLETGRTAKRFGAGERHRYSPRSVLVTALLVTAMAGAGVSAAALLTERGGDGGVVPVSPTPVTTVGTPSAPTYASGSPTPVPSLSRSASGAVSASATSAPTSHSRQP
ncbi:serine/threonine-protein kinase [Streptomyces resistomycificus]|uniref:non-specific serine/threonine protein kinase n=1 Tax=Streptomyces resistomycificus TaxID=67356 RepID=A0A0L8KZZ4_9ACTN|nr:serine/threonine-protein kinase [Streptomyces resistomycificus]KOG31543.1 serine/threonine protein kinase [Streptomyces resistomycificus]